MKYLKTLVLGLLLVAFGAGWAQAGSATTVHLKFINDSGKSVHFTIFSSEPITLAAGQQWSYPIKNPAGTKSTVHDTYFEFTGSMYNSPVLSIKVRNQLINGQAQLEGVSFVKSMGGGDCTYPYEISGWDGAECTLVVTIPKYC